MLTALEDSLQLEGVFATYVCSHVAAAWKRVNKQCLEQTECVTWPKTQMSLKIGDFTWMVLISGGSYNPVITVV